MKRGHIILIAGAVLLVSGIVVSTVWGISFAGSFIADNTLIQRSLGPGESVDAMKNVDSQLKPLFLAVGVDEQQSRTNDGFSLRETVKDPDGRIVSTSEFVEPFSTTIDPAVAGTYTVTIANLDADPVTVAGMFGHIPFLEADGRPDWDMMSAGGLGTIIAGGGLATVGIITLIAGAIVTIIDGRKRDGTTATASEGGITYRKD